VTTTVPVPREVTYSGNASALSAKAKTVLTALAKKLERGASVTVTGYAYHNATLARLRAKVVADYLESKVGIHVTIKIVTTSVVGKVNVITERL
jgi:outer membrane protein OmpA-like peptidoglycan-associated protein